MDKINESIKHFKKGLDFIRKDEFHNAINELKAASVIDKNNPEVLYNLGIAYGKVGLFRSANGILKTILDLPFQTVFVLDVKKLYAFSFIELGNYSEAMKILDEVIKVSNYDVKARSMKGYCFEMLGDVDKAIATFRLVLDIDHHNINAVNSLSYLLAKNGKVDEALKRSEKLIGVGKESAAYLDTLGFIYMKKGNLKQAEKYFKKAYSIDSFSDEIKSHLQELNKKKLS